MRLCAQHIPAFEWRTKDDSAPCNGWNHPAHVEGLVIRSVCDADTIVYDSVCYYGRMAAALAWVITGQLELIGVAPRDLEDGKWEGALTNKHVIFCGVCAPKLYGPTQLVICQADQCGLTVQWPSSQVRIGQAGNAAMNMWRYIHDPVAPPPPIIEERPGSESKVHEALSRIDGCPVCYSDVIDTSRWRAWLAAETEVSQ